MSATEVKLFGKWTYEDVMLSDLSLVDYIAVNKTAHLFLPHTQGRYQMRRFRKALCPIVERLACSMMMHGRNNGKKLMAVRIVKHAFEIIHLLTDKNPIQVFVDAVKNGGPREDSTRVGSAGVVRRQAVDVSPLRRVNQAIYLICTGARNSAFRNIKSISECLADEIMNCAKESSNSYAIKKKDEIERVAKDNHGVLSVAAVDDEPRGALCRVDPDEPTTKAVFFLEDEEITELSQAAAEAPSMESEANSSPAVDHSLITEFSKRMKTKSCDSLSSGASSPFKYARVNSSHEDQHDSLGWVNYILETTWPHSRMAFNELTKQIVSREVSAAVRSKKLMGFNIDIQISTEFDIGSKHPVLKHIVATHTGRGAQEGIELLANVDMAAGEGFHFELKIAGRVSGLPVHTSVGLSSFTLQGNACVLLAPLIDSVPVFAGGKMYFLDLPNLHVEFFGMQSAGKLLGPILVAAVQSTTEQILSSFVVPGGIYVPIAPNIHGWSAMDKKEYLEVVKLPLTSSVVHVLPKGDTHELGGPRQLSVDYVPLLRLVSVKLFGLETSDDIAPDLLYSQAFVTVEQGDRPKNWGKDGGIFQKGLETIGRKLWMSDGSGGTLKQPPMKTKKARAWGSAQGVAPKGSFMQNISTHSQLMIERLAMDKGMSYEEIAEIAGISENQVKVLVEMQRSLSVAARQI
ncbi:unnamed protein product [Effrenium voratum]|nr:unnamed protein product [Effrenium voratum]